MSHYSSTINGDQVIGLNVMGNSVLIVEDSHSKLSSIQAVVERVVPGIRIRQACSVRSAISELGLMLPDFVIADMSLPTYDIVVKERGGTPRPFGGIEVFEELERIGKIVPILVVTSYPVLTEGNQTMGLHELSSTLKTDFPDYFVGTVYFDSAYSDWERQMEGYLYELLSRNDGN